MIALDNLGVPIKALVEGLLKGVYMSVPLNDPWWLGKFTVVMIYRDSGEVIKNLYTGTRYECHEVMKELIKHHRWNVRDLSLIDESNGRHASFVLR